MMKMKILLYFMISTLLIANTPERINNNIENSSYTQDNRSAYIRDQKRAYKRIVSLGEKEGFSKEKIDEEVFKLEKRYGTDYEIIFKYFSYNIKDISSKEKQIEKDKKMNSEMKIEYTKKIKEAKIPENIKEYIENKAQIKYPNNYSEQIKYTQELIEFYNFIKK